MNASPEIFSDSRISCDTFEPEMMVLKVWNFIFPKDQKQNFRG
jgi:hypothetical protein